MKTPRQRFLDALAGLPLDRPPAWIMRQAGRYLPEYRALKERHDFLTLVKTPDLATEVTLQPLRRFPLDAAILFSDILVVPEALGQPYRFREEGGISLDFALRGPADLARLSPAGLEERLAYVPAALRQIRGALGPDTALLGFAGSPWTLAAYMIEGGSSSSWSRAKALFHEDPSAFSRLLELLADAVARYLLLQAEAGVDAVQIFDSWASACPAVHYEELSLRWIRAVIARLAGRVPVILYSRGLGHLLPALASTGATALGLDWTVDLPAARRALPPTLAVQGNLDPAVLDTTPEIVQKETRRLVHSMQSLPGWIFNLGHGIHPTARPENVAALLEALHHPSPPAP